MLGRLRVVEPVAGRRLDVGAAPGCEPLRAGGRRVDAEAAVELVVGHLLGARRDVDALAGAGPLAGVEETSAISGLAPRFREWRAPGLEAQTNSW